MYEYLVLTAKFIQTRVRIRTMYGPVRIGTASPQRFIDILTESLSQVKSSQSASTIRDMPYRVVRDSRLRASRL